MTTEEITTQLASKIEQRLERKLNLVERSLINYTVNNLRFDLIEWR